MAGDKTDTDDTKTAKVVDTTAEVDPAESEDKEQNDLVSKGAGEGADDADSQEDGTKKRPWFIDRLDRVTREKWDARRETREAQARASKAEAELEILRARDKAVSDQTKTPDGTSKPQPTMSQEEIDKLVETKANQKAAQDAFNKACNTVYTAGKSLYGDFDQVLGNYRDVGGLSPDFVAEVMDVDEEVAHKVLYEIGKDRDEADRIMSLTPVKRIAEITRRVSKLKEPPKPKPVSQAPDPIKGVSPRASAPPADPDKMSTADWMKWRENNLKAQMN